MTSGGPNYPDDARLLEFKSQDKVYSDNSSANVHGEDPDFDPQEFCHDELSVMSSDKETWFAPFQDSDLDEDHAKTVCETVCETAACANNEGSRSDLPMPLGRLYDAALKVQAVVKFTRMQRIKKRARWLTKKIIVFVLSHVGLTSLVGLYAVAGGFIFQRLERNFGHIESGETSRSFVLRNVSFKSLPSFQDIRNQHVDALWNMTENLNVLQPLKWKQSALLELELFERDFLQVIQKEGLEVTEEHVNGRYPEGSWSDKSNNKEQTNGWTYSSALLFAVTVITTIGYGDTVPKSWEAKIVCIVYAAIGIPLTLLCLANIGSLLASVYRFTWKHASHLSLILVRAPERNKPLVETSEVRVPISVSVATMIVYILGGAAIFSEWENWTFLEGSYFCFITLSTIGFGDFVPGKDTETLDSNAKRVVCALYLLFGLALLSMIFQLIQDSVTIVVGRYASFLGLSEAQIQRDIIETSIEVGHKNDLPHLKEKEVTAQPMPGFDMEQNGPREKFLHLAPDAQSLRRVMTLPTRKMTPQRPVSRLQSVPEERLLRSQLGLNENVSRKQSLSCPDDPQHPDGNGLSKDEEETVRKVLSRNYNLHHVIASKERDKSLLPQEQFHG